MDLAEFEALVAERILVCDGAMGTMLYARGVTVHQNFDGLNLERPDLVEEIHRGYVEAGVDILETNTFGANRIKLAEYGLAPRLAEVNAAGVAIARRAAGGRQLVAGSIGPLGRALREDDLDDLREARDVFREQAGPLLEAGVDLLILETFPGVVELRCAVEAVRGLSERVPIVAQLTFDDQGTSLRGESAESAGWALSRLPVQVVGANCCVGPQPMYDALARLAPHADRPLSAMPNAGMPQVIGHRLHYLTTPDYFGLFAKRFARIGARILGGCCGTTPDHLRSVVEVARALSPGSRPIAPLPPPREAAPAPPPLSPQEKSPLGRLLGSRFTISVEINPPQGLDMSKAIAGARLLRDVGADAVNIPDGPRATARMNPLSLAVAVQTRTRLEVILHFCCRDRNLLGLQADLIGAHSLGIRNILAVTGDPPKVGDYPDLHGVFEVDSIGLVRLLRNLNSGLDMGGRPIGGRTRFLIGVGCNPAARRRDEEIERFGRKVAAGAEFALTQPVYEPRLLEDFLADVADHSLPILAGILPLAGRRNAEFLHNEVPGMQIPAAIRERMARAGDGARGRAEGLAIAREALAAVRDLGLAGAYVMPPLGHYGRVAELLEGFI